LIVSIRHIQISKFAKQRKATAAFVSNCTSGSCWLTQMWRQRWRAIT